MEVAVYKGDEFLTLGTIKECAEKLGVKESTIRHYLSPAYKRKIAKRKSDDSIIVIKIEEE